MVRNTLLLAAKAATGSSIVLRFLVLGGFLSGKDADEAKELSALLDDFSVPLEPWDKLRRYILECHLADTYFLLCDQVDKFAAESGVAAKYLHKKYSRHADGLFQVSQALIALDEAAKWN